MKTTEEKARAYDKVRKKIAIRFGSNVADEFFAEFEGSKDEEIRKALLEMVHDTTGDELWVDYNVHKEEALDWLERQGEQKFEMKSAEESLGIDSDTYNKIVDECIYGDDKVEPKFKVGDKIYLKPEYRMPDDDTPIANTVKEIRRIDDKHYRFDGSYIFIEDQDKYELVVQRPAWSDEDERLCQCLIEDQEEALNKVNNDKYGHSEIISDLKEMYHERIDWLKSLKDRVQSQPKQEWSEEDEKNLRRAIRATKVVYPVAADWLQSLQDRVQPKQEWNEEDEQHIDSLLKRLNALCRNKFERTRFAISEDRDWLKSLRPQNRWKPSEDDIIILEKLINGELEPKVFQATLHGILEQLKKLKEGKV